MNIFMSGATTIGLSVFFLSIICATVPGIWHLALWLDLGLGLGLSLASTLAPALALASLQVSWPQLTNSC